MPVCEVAFLSRWNFFKPGGTNSNANSAGSQNKEPMALQLFLEHLLIKAFSCTISFATYLICVTYITNLLMQFFKFFQLEIHRLGHVFIF